MSLVKMRRPAAALAALFWATAPACADDPPQNPRIALVIGESAYADATLPTTANDAGLVAQVLQAAGFEVVGARDLDEKSVRAALRDFLDKANAAGPNMQAFVYFSGRALQYAGDDYLVPVDARIVRDTDAPIEAVKLADFTHALSAAPGLARIVVIDGARANPYARQGEPLAGGLALIEPDPGELVAYNAAPGAIAGDEPGPYGVYAKTLAGALRQGGVDIADVFAQTRLAVNQATAGAEAPWSASKLNGPYYVFERAADAPAPRLAPAAPKKALRDYSPEEAYNVAVERDTLAAYEEYLRDYPRAAEARRVQAILAARREALFWERAWRDNSPRAYWTYLRRYPHGPHAADADRRLRALAAGLEPPRDFVSEDYPDLPPPPPDELVYADRPVYYFGGDDFGPPPPRPPRDFYVEEDEGWRRLPPPPPPAGLGLLPALATAIPLLAESRPYRDKPHRDGRADAGAPPPPPAPKGPPPLPRNVQPQASKGAPPAPSAASAAKPTPAAAGRPTPTGSPGVEPAPAAAPRPTPSGPSGEPKPARATPEPAAEARPEKPASTPSAAPAPKAAPGPERPAATPKPAPAAERPTPKPAPAAERPAPKAGPAPGAERAEPKPPAPAAERPKPAPSAEAHPPAHEEQRPAHEAKTCGEPGKPACK